MAAWGVEARVPFLDLEFLDLAMTIDAEHKRVTPGGMEKAILRNSAPPPLSCTFGSASRVMVCCLDPDSSWASSKMICSKRSEEHTSALHSLMRTAYATLYMQKKQRNTY